MSVIKHANWHTDVAKPLFSNWISRPVLPTTFIIERTMDRVQQCVIALIAKTTCCVRRLVALPVPCPYTSEYARTFSSTRIKACIKASVCLRQSSPLRWITLQAPSWLADVGPSGQMHVASQCSLTMTTCCRMLDLWLEILDCSYFHSTQPFA